MSIPDAQLAGRVVLHAQAEAAPGLHERAPIAVTLSRFPTVTETFILREIDELERQGQPVRLVPLLKHPAPVTHKAAVPWTARALFTPFLSWAIVAENLRTIALRPLAYGTTLARLLWGTWRHPATLVHTLGLFPKAVYLAQRLRHEGVRHIHAHFASHPTTLALVISRVSSITFSFTAHAHDIQGDRGLLRWKLRQARFVRTISAFNKRYLDSLYPREAGGKVHLVHVGVDHQRYEAAARGGDRAGAIPRILCVAAHKPYKGLPVLIEACRHLRDQGLNFECHLVGSGPMRAELEQRIREHGLQHQIHLLGPQPEEEVARMMAAATMFVLASVVEPSGKMEGIPVALMEAMASGRAVVSTAISGIPELVEHGVTGLLVPPGDAVALAEAMRTVLTRPDLAQALGERGQAKVRRDFSLAGCVRELIALLDRESGEPVATPAEAVNAGGLGRRGAERRPRPVPQR